jgi:PAS domain S-box-containing protein
LDKANILDCLPLGIFIVSDKMVVSYWNSWMEDYTKIQRGEIVGKVITEVYPHLKEPKYLDRIDALLKGSPPTFFSSLLHRYIIPVKQKNGEYRVQNTTIIPVPSPEGSKTYALFAINDVTDLTNRFHESRSMRDMALEAKRTAEEATKLKDRFVSLVSHDLKNPLTSILGFMNLIKAELEELSKGEISEMVDIAIQSGDNMLNMIDDILSISRIRMGKMELRKRFLDPNSIMTKTLFALRPLAEKKGVAIEVKLAPRSRIFADAVMIEQVFQNLLSNAIKFCKPGGQISVFQPSGEPSTVCVADTGVGIQFANLEDVFNHEKKTTLPGTAGEVGTGYGLPLSKDIVEAHGGTLAAETEVGKGSKFFVRLPYAQPVVLLVDDNKLTRKILESHLLELDLKVVEANNGKEAMEKIKDVIPNLVITDINMPLVNGFELIKRLKENLTTEKLPIIVITSDTNLEPRERALQMGADDFIQKDAKAGDFMLRVAKYITAGD